MRVMHLTTHLNVGGISQYIYSLLKEMRPHLDYACVVSSGGVYEERMRSIDVDVFNMHIKTKNSASLKLLIATIPLLRVIRTHKIELMHAHSRVTQVLAWYVSLMTGIPFISTWHGFYENKLGRRLVPAQGAKVIAISDQVKEDLMQTFRVPEERIRLIYNSIDMDQFEAKVDREGRTREKERLGFSGNSFVIGTVARLVEDKGHACFIKAFKQITDTYPHVRVLIVGEGKHKDQLQELIATLGLQEKIVFVGAVENVARVIDVMDVFVLVPTLKEGFGLAVIEAMTLKKPVIVSNIGGLLSIVEHEKRGLVTRADDIHELASNLKRLIDDPRLRETLAKNAYHYCRANFEIRPMAEKMRAVYAECIKVKRTP